MALRMDIQKCIEYKEQELAYYVSVKALWDQYKKDYDKWREDTRSVDIDYAKGEAAYNMLVSIFPSLIRNNLIKVSAANQWGLDGKPDKVDITLRIPNSVDYSLLTGVPVEPTSPIIAMPVYKNNSRSYYIWSDEKVVNTIKGQIQSLKMLDSESESMTLNQWESFKKTAGYMENTLA